MGQQEYKRYEGRIWHEIAVPGLILESGCEMRVGVSEPAHYCPFPSIAVTVRSAELQINLPTMSPDTARQIGRLLIAAADDAESVVAQAA